MTINRDQSINLSKIIDSDELFKMVIDKIDFDDYKTYSEKIKTNIYEDDYNLEFDYCIVKGFIILDI